MKHGHGWGRLGHTDTSTNRSRSCVRELCNTTTFDMGSRVEMEGCVETDPSNQSTNKNNGMQGKRHIEAPRRSRPQHLRLEAIFFGASRLACMLVAFEGPASRGYVPPWKKGGIPVDGHDVTV
jgi:hypothetical protein